MDTVSFGRFAESVTSSLIIKSIDWCEFEQSLCVRFRPPCEPDKLRKTRRHHSDWKLMLADPVQCIYQRGKLILWNVLEFIL